MTFLLFCLILFLFSPLPAFCENPGQTKGTEIITVLISTDTSGLNLSTALQYALAQLLRNLGNFSVQLSSYILQGFSPADTQRTHQTLVSRLFSFAYMEKERISIFLFNSDYPGQFIVSSQPLFDSPGQQLTTHDIERKLQATFVLLVKLMRNKRYQYLPGASPKKETVESDEDIKRKQAIEASHLYRELSNIQENPFYLGANVGMARFGSTGVSTSVVNFGGYLGYSVFSRLGLELGVDLFSYALFSLNAHYRLPLSQKHVYLNATFGVSHVTFSLTDNKGMDSSLPVNKFLFGPGINFDIPLLGTTIRGGINLYLGQGAALIGNYGANYSIDI